MEALVIPSFEMSCKAMFEQVDAAFQKGMVEHTNAAQQHLESASSSLAIALRVYILCHIYCFTRRLVIFVLFPRFITFQHSMLNNLMARIIDV